MAGTVSKVIRFRDEEEFIDDVGEAMEIFSRLAVKYGHNPVEGIILWDYVGVRDREGVKVFRVGEFSRLRGTLDLDPETLEVMERHFDEMKGRDDLGVEDIARLVDLLNEELGEEMVYYEAYDLGLERNTAYIILNLPNLAYLDGILEGDEREDFERAVKLLIKYV
ncbi:hypothetical protein A3L12_05800 [Thermococcus sp. P6]|uniref:hypothetical protein n=1 Tax=Thermococcus sp. P6 TaxID=122420 RepID=UPI000B59A080|nr:hypothetical protein [Thermococcus sp. P6]ASJ10848.1 hypothetical protein A3L12_05800 [Thermococcus sp. P6]